MSKRKRIVIIISMIALLTLLMAVSVSASTTEESVYDTMQSGFKTGMESLSLQLLGIIGVIVPTIISILGVKIAIQKGLGMFKSLTR